MIRLSPAGLLLAIFFVAAVAAEAQELSSSERAYFRAVARYFQVSESEIAILGHWEVPPEEIPVLLFMARRAGVSAEALVALRESGRTWPELSARYQIGASALHVPLHDPGAAGRLASLYERYRDTPVERWGDIRPNAEEIVDLVNVRVLSQSIGMPADDIMRRTGTTRSFVEIYSQLIR